MELVKKKKISSCQELERKRCTGEAQKIFRAMKLFYMILK